MIGVGLYSCVLAREAGVVVEYHLRLASCSVAGVSRGFGTGVISSERRRISRFRFGGLAVFVQLPVLARDTVRVN